MTLLLEATTAQAPRNEEVENKDPFVTTPPREAKSQSSKPATPSKKANTPLHKRFLQEVNMGPDTASTPPRTPSRSPTRNKIASKQTLEIGQNGFYFSMEIPERKIVASRPASRAATPEVKTGRVTPSPEKISGRLTPGRVTPGRLSPSPKKDTKSEMKGTPSGGGKVRDILRKNLFGTPTKKVTNSRWGDVDKKMSPSKDGRYRSQTSDVSGSGRPMKEAAANITSTSTISQKPDPSTQSSAQLSSTPATSATPTKVMSKGQSHTTRAYPESPLPAVAAASRLDSTRASPTSTPSNIGHLMANHSNKSAKVQTLPTSGGMESMPTPLRKMQERLFLNSPHVLHKKESTETDVLATPPKTGTVLTTTSALNLKGAATQNVGASPDARAYDAATTITKEAPQGPRTMPQGNRLTKLLLSPITTSSPASSSRPNTATTTSFPSPSTPSRPGLSSRSKSFGTPARIRSSMQEDMFKVQESLKRSLGQEAFEKAASRPTTPISPAAAASKRATAVPDHSTNPSKLAARPLSMISALEPNAHSVPRKPLTTATRKPRPKSMIVGSAKVLETLASQIDSPRERAKLRSIGAIVPTQQSKFAVSRPSDAPWTSRGSTQATTTRKPVGAQPTVRTTRSAAPSSNSQPKRAALPTPTAAPRSSKQRVVSAEVIADRVAAWNKENSRPPALKPAPKLPVRSKSVKTLSKRTVKPAPAARPASGRVCTPEPKDTNNDSGTAESFTPPGLPTQLPMSPSKKLLVAPTTPAPTSKDARKQRLQNAHRRPQPPSVAAQLRTPHPVATPATTMVNKRHTWVEGFDEEDHNRYRTPSKEVQSRLDEAIDRKIQEDRMRAGWI